MLLRTFKPLPTGHFLQPLANISKATHGLYAGVLKRCKLLVGSALAAGNDRSGMAHAFTRRRCDAGNIRHHRLTDMGFNERRCLLLRARCELLSRLAA